MVYEYSATVVDIVDADSVVLDVNLGFRLTWRAPFRLYGPDIEGKMGLNAPELKTPEGVKARDFLAQLLASHSHNLMAHTKKDRKEKFGRYLVTLYGSLFEGEAAENINRLLIDSGHAVLRKY